jgi:hypothetical protein
MDNMAQEAQGLDWDKHEAEILDLFVTRNKTLKEVMTHMKGRHGVVATYASQFRLSFTC